MLALTLVVQFGCGRINYDPVSVGGDGGRLDGGPDGEPPAGTFFVDSLSVGREHTCAIRQSQLWCWGNGASGRLGNGDILNQTLPVQVGIGTLWTSVSAGGRHSCAISDQATLYCWGDNDSGQVGNGGGSDPREPVAIMSGWQQVRTGFLHTAGVSTEGTLWAWGDNSEAQLGQGIVGGTESSPTQVGTSNNWLQAASTPNNFGCAIALDETLWCWGSNEEGQLGTGSAQIMPVPNPMQVPGTQRWRQIVAGEEHTCGIAENDDAWCWGDNRNGQLGNDTLTDSAAPLATSGTWRMIAAGGLSTCGIAIDGALFCWGNNVNGQLGLGHNDPALSPQQVGTRRDWVEVALGLNHMCARRVDGSLWCTGLNVSGRLGLGDETARNLLSPVVDPS